ncbi:long-chain fatty acid transporter [Enterovibrio norvegicus FF-33]|uniref:outer membrane protein transport protein n=1 Tax=Enterovibrio TaxID=188143 RepID=UPI0002DDB1F8|nr:outer membrane protein transport protein [Enterovibrio norvegicus]OEE70126.1 long-chain fatty acid transporter [Enterovibrio norvegicus FF-33]
MSKKLSRIAIALAVALAAPSAWSAGFQVSEHSASGLGRAYAGEAAMADNASVMARNPASMALFTETQVSGALHIVDPEIDITDKTTGQKASDVAPMQVVPASYYVNPLNDKWAFGVGLYTTYGVATDYPDAFNAGDLAGDTSLVSVNLNPAASYRINDKFSVGAGLNIVYAMAELNRHYGIASTAVSNDFSDKLITMEGDTWGFGWNAGAVYELSDKHRFGLAYRSRIDLEFNGDFTDHSGNIIPGGGETSGDLNVPLPAIAEFSGFHQLNQTWAVHYSVMWSQWSKFTELKATGTGCSLTNGICFQKDEKYDDAFRYSVGTTYTLDETWTLRTGFAFDEQAGKSTLSIPDTDRYWFSGGATYQYSPQLSFDVGLTYIYSKSNTLKESSSVSGIDFTFDGKGAAYLAAMQANYTF